jgi:hypothetical protein
MSRTFNVLADRVPEAVLLGKCQPAGVGLCKPRAGSGKHESTKLYHPRTKMTMAPIRGDAFLSPQLRILRLAPDLHVHFTSMTQAGIEIDVPAQARDGPQFIE